MQEQPPIEVEYGIDMAVATIVDNEILDELQIRKLQEAFNPVIAKNGDGELVINFAGVRFMSSSMLGLLVRIQKAVDKAGGTLRLANLAPNLEKVFEITRLNKIFTISDTL